MFSERSHIQVIFATELPEKWISDANEPFSNTKIFRKCKINGSGPSYKHCPVATGTACGLEFIVDAKAQSSVFWKISYSGIFSNWVALKINFKNEWVFSNTIISRKL